MYSYLKKWITIYLIFTTYITIAQVNPNATLQQFPLIHIGQKDGLIPNYINDLAVDSLGQLQLATFGTGILSYGGYEFTSTKSTQLAKFPIIRKLKLIDNKHYFITSGELYKWDSAIDSLTLIFKDDSPIINFYQLAPSKMLVSNYRGSYIVENNKGLYSYTKLSFPSPIMQLVNLSSKITVAVFADGKIISEPFSPSPNIIYNDIKGGNLKLFEMDDHLVVFEENHISRLDKKNFTLLQKIPSPHFTVFYQDKQTIWMGSGAGIYTMSKEGLKKLHTSPQLSEKDISAITRTNDGTLWIGTYGNGLYKLYDEQIVQYAFENAGLGQIYSVTRLLKLSDKFLITSNKGLYLYDNGQISSIQIPRTAKGQALFSGVDEKSGDLYVGGEGFVLKKEYDKENFKGYFHEVFNNNVITSIVHLKGNILVGSHRGLYLFDKHFNLIRDFNEGAEKKVRNIYQIHIINDNHIIYGDFYNLYETDFKNTREFELEGIKGKVLSFLPAGDQLFWLGTSSGIVYLYDFNKKQFVREIHSRLGKNIYSISAGTDFSLAIGTEMGIERHHSDGSVQLYDERIRQYEVNYNSLVHLNNNDLLVGTVGGLIKISDGYTFKPKSKIWLEDFMVNNEKISVKEILESKKPLSLSHKNNNISFQVKLLNFQEPLNTRIQYRLAGFEEDWGPIMNLGNVQYTNLPPGEYRIMVNILYSQGDEVTYTLPLQIIILKPFWLHPLFLIFLGLISAGIIFLGYLWFQRKTLRDNNKLQRMVDARTEEINKINKGLEQKIFLRTKDLHHKNQELTKNIELKKVFQSQVRLISSNTQDIVCLISPSYSIKMISDSIEQMLGLSSMDLIDTHIGALLTDEGSTNQIISYLSQVHEQPAPIILSLNHSQTKEKVLVEILGKKIYNRNSQEVQGYVLNIRNVSEREFLKDELKAVYKNIHRDFHDEVGNKLAKIIALVSVLKIELNDLSRGVETMGKIEHTAKNLYHDTRDFIWSLDQENNKVVELGLQLRDFGAMLFDGSNIEFKCNLEINQNVILKPNLVRDLLLIMKEIMTNALKHSKATEAHLIIKQYKSHMVLLLKDNGIGITVNQNGKGNGMKNIHYRAVRCNADLINKSRKGCLIGVRIKC